jgi:hypothetical protein
LRYRLFILLATGAVAAIAAAVAVAGPSGSDNGTMCVENAQLRPENETPTSTSTAKGHAQIKVRNDGTIEYRWFILNKDAESFFVGHIHRKNPNSPVGPPVVFLFSGPATTERHIRGEGETTSPVAADICENPTAYYVNFHTTANAPGAIRGDLG